MVKSVLIEAALNVPGAVGKVIAIVNAPQSGVPAEPETLSYQIEVEEEAETNMEVVIAGKAEPVIIAEEQGFI